MNEELENIQIESISKILDDIKPIESKVKLYYTEDGWLCNRYPYDFPIEDENRYIEVWSDEALETYQASVGYCWKVNDEQKLELAVYDQNEVDKISLQEEQKQLEEWFKYYDTQMIQYQRYQRLNLEFNKDINELDSQAITNALRIKEIRALLEETEEVPEIL